jgi:peptidoglycan/xylan/chitin deacetylase (PgdA/CDA1 family)
VSPVAADARGVAGTALELGLRRSRRARVGVAVVFHEVAAPEDTVDDPLESVPVPAFAAQVRALARRFRIVRAAELLDAAERRRPGEPFPAAITFDDDLRSHVEVAAPILESVGVPGTFYLNGAGLDGPHTFWWQRLVAATRRGLVGGDAPPVPLPSGGELRGTAHEMLRQVEALAPGERMYVAGVLGERLGGDPPDSGLRTTDVRRLARGGHEIGFHTRGHHPLTFLDDPALDAALRDGRDELQLAGAGELRTIAYPHGLADDRVAERARAAGFALGFTTAHGALCATDEPLLLPRVYPSLTSSGQLLLSIGKALVRRAQHA